MTWLAKGTCVLSFSRFVSSACWRSQKNKTSYPAGIAGDEHRLRDPPVPSALVDLTRMAAEGDEAGAEAAPRGWSPPLGSKYVPCFGRLAHPDCALEHAEATIGRHHDHIGIGVRLEADQSHRDAVLLAALLLGLHLRFSGANDMGVPRRDRVATAWRLVLDDVPGAGEGAVIHRDEGCARVQGKGAPALMKSCISYAAAPWMTPSGVWRTAIHPSRSCAPMVGSSHVIHAEARGAHREWKSRSEVLHCVPCGIADCPPHTLGRPHAGAFF